MKNRSFAIAALLAVVPATHAADQGAFISISAGQSRSQIDRDFAPNRIGRAFATLAGYRWAVNSRLSLGVEGGYAALGEANYHLVEPYSYTFYEGGTVSGVDRERIAYKAKAYLLGINSQWNVNDRWNLSAHYGWARYRTTLLVLGSSTFYDKKTQYDATSNDIRNGRYFGLGVGFNVAEYLNLSVTADRYKPTYRQIYGDTFSYGINVWGLRAEYLF